MRLRIWTATRWVTSLLKLRIKFKFIDSLIYWGRFFEQMKYSLLLQFRWLSFPLRSTRAQLDTATDRDLRVVRSARCRGDVQFISSTVSPDDHCHSAWLCFLNQLINDSSLMTHSKLKSNSPVKSWPKTFSTIFFCQKSRQISWLNMNQITIVNFTNGLNNFDDVTFYDSFNMTHRSKIYLCCHPIFLCSVNFVTFILMFHPPNVTCSTNALTAYAFWHPNCTVAFVQLFCTFYIE